MSDLPTRAEQATREKIEGNMQDTLNSFQELRRALVEYMECRASLCAPTKPPASTAILKAFLASYRMTDHLREAGVAAGCVHLEMPVVVDEADAEPRVRLLDSPVAWEAGMTAQVVLDDPAEDTITVLVGGDAPRRKKLLRADEGVTWERTDAESA